jgi:hypothetical protein
MRHLPLVALALALSSPALAQSGAGIPLNEDARTLTPEEREKQKKLDDAYKASLKRIPDAKPADPWGNVRNVEAPNAAPARAKPAPKKPGAPAN